MTYIHGWMCMIFANTFGVCGGKELWGEECLLITGTFRLEYELYMFLHTHVDGRRITGGQVRLFPAAQRWSIWTRAPVMIALLQNVLRCGRINPGLIGHS